MADLQNIPRKKLKILSAVQPRESIDQETAAGWAELLVEDPEFQMPPGVAFQNPRTHELILADGFTRHAAYTIAERTLIPMEVREGDEGDAVWHALSANSKHGRPLSHSEARAAIEKALDHRNRGEMTIPALAKLLGRSQRTIERVVSERKSAGKKEAAKSKGEREAKDRFSAEAIAAIDKIGLCNEQAKIAILNGSIKKPEDELIALAEYDCEMQLRLAPFFFTHDLNLASAINALQKRPTAIDRPLEEYVLYTLMKGVDQQFYFHKDTVEVHIGLLAQTPVASIVKPPKPVKAPAKVVDEAEDDPNEIL